ncbi:MAG: glycosyltransferase [Candidatus Aminicenantes bacterium]|nr:glycosyltransferase [Candidatus Aminicenantes bacterium]
MLTILYSYYNSSEALGIQINNWSQYPIELMKKLHFILIDDCSDNIADLAINFPINLTQLRITDNIPWNQPGAKNLGFKFAKTDWVFNSDIDHVLKPEMCEKLVELKKDKGTVYYFSRFSDKGESRNSHPNSFLIHKDVFWELGGYDEDFCGHYGYDDILLKTMIQSQCKTEHLNSINLINYTSLFSSDLDRNRRKNKRLLKRKKKQLQKGKYQNKKILRFNWEVVKNLNTASHI